MTSVRSCPACGAALPVRATGRPATYCSTSCRQSAHRAKQRAKASAERAAAARDRVARDLEEALGVLHKAAGLLAEPRRAAEVEVGRTVAEGGQGWHAEIPSGWENDVAELADVAARRARTVVEQLREHARAAVEHRQAVPVAGIHRTPAARRRDDEPPGGPSLTGAAPSVALAAAEDLTTKLAPADGGAEVDRDALFDAIEDVVYELTDTGAGHLLPVDVAEALTAPAEALAEVLARASGDGPLDGLLTAAGRVLAAAAPVLGHEGIPERARAALTALQTAATAISPGCVLAHTLRAGSRFLDRGAVICGGEPQQCQCETPHPDGMAIELRPVTVLRDAEPDTTSDPFGRELIKFWCRDEETSREGYISFGPQGVVRVEPAPPYFVLTTAAATKPTRAGDR